MSKSITFVRQYANLKLRPKPYPRGAEVTMSDAVADDLIARGVARPTGGPAPLDPDDVVTIGELANPDSPVRQVLSGIVADDVVTVGQLETPTSAARQVLDGLIGDTEVVWDDATAQKLADMQGYWTVTSETPPAQTTMYGVPVLWIDKTTTLTPIPVQPPQPAWSDANSRITIPSGVTGVQYVIEGGGHPAGTTVAQGAQVTTSGSFPRNVTVTAQALPGYVIFGAPTWRHNFPDPAAITLLTSDGFSGAQANTIVGRQSDAALGGSAQQWLTDSGSSSVNHNTSVNTARTFRINASGQLEHADVVGDLSLALRYPITTAKNLRLEFDVVSISNNGGAWTDAPFNIKIERKPAGQPTQANDSIYYRGVQVAMGAQRVRAYCAKVGGGANELLDAAASGSGTVAGANAGGSWPVVGAWSITLYETTLTIVSPGGTRVWDLSGATHDIGGTAPVGTKIALYSDLANRSLVLDNVKVSKVGF